MDTEINRQVLARAAGAAQDRVMNTVQRAAAEQIGKHRRLLRTGRDGRILSALMLPRLRWAPPAGYGVLTTTGRKTGKPRRKCVRVIRRGDRGYLVARAAICDPVCGGDFGECWLHLRGLPSRAKVKELHRYWFETGIPVVIDLKETRP
jgi:hypothetical protein